MTEIKIDNLKFVTRLEKIKRLIPDPIVIILGSREDLEQANLNSALFNYLLGYEFPNTVIVLDTVCKIFSAKKKLEILSDLSNVDTFVIDKDLGNLAEVSRILSKIQNLRIVDKNKLGGMFCQNILKDLVCQDVSKEIQHMFLYKDEDELRNCKKAGIVMSHIIKNCTELAKDNLLDIEKLEEIIDRPIDGIDNSSIEYSFDPELSKYSYRIGIRYNGYCAEGGRTVFSDLNIFYNAQKFILGLIRPGDNSKIVYEKVSEYLRNNGFTGDDNFLYTTGLLNEEVNFKNEFRILNGLVFVLKLSNGSSILSNTFYLDETPVFLTPNDKFEDFLDNRPRFRDKSREHELDIRRKEHQKELLEKLIKDQYNYYKNKNNSEGSEDVEVKHRTYAKESMIPRKGKVCVDFNNNAVCIPISDHMIPIHIVNIKNVVLVDETLLKFNFEFSNLKNSKFLSSIKCINISERNGREIYDQIQDLKTRFSVSSDKEIIKQDKLIEKSKKAALEDIFMRTDIKTAIKKSKVGSLELHENGFRFLDDKIDILFSNIRHVFYVKGNVQTKTILHFHLHSPILVSQKKTKNIQFYQEAGSNLTYNTHKRGDEHMEFIIEKEEEDRQKRLNYAFEDFVNKIENETSLKVQRPKDGFYGVPHKESVYIQKTHECLVALHEQPFFVLTLEDIEVVNFERVVYNVKTSDVVFIFKDKTIAKILSIESSYMNKFKDYLDSNNIVFMETIFNIQWKNVLKKILEDPISFYATGGWTELLIDDNESEEEEEEEEEESSISSESEESTDMSTVSTDISDEEESSFEDSDDEDYSSEEDSSDDGRKKRRR